MKKILSFLLALSMVLSCAPMPALAEETQQEIVVTEPSVPETTVATEPTVPETTVATEPTVPETTVVTEPEVICTCESDDPAYHAPFCALFVMPENPVCHCAEKCTEDTANEWCDVCYFDLAACVGEGEGVPFTGASGECGDNLTWTLDEDGTLTISGTGDMWDTDATWNSDDTPKAPWGDLADQILRVCVQEGVTSIGDWMFGRCENVVEVALPATIQSIGYWSFYHCSSLREINLPEGLESIQECAFEGCKSLTRIVIPDSVTYINAYVFSSCTGLTEVVLPDNFPYISNFMFAGCSSLTEITLPESVTYIGYYALSGCSSLTSIDIPNSISSILGGLFEGCSGLTTITIPANIKSFGDEVFDNCTNLTEVRFLGDAPQFWDVISDVHLTVYYPAGNDTWTEEIMQTYGANLTWRVNCAEHTFENGFCANCDGYEPAVLNGDVYEIYNAGQLYWFAEKVNSGDVDINGKLMDNIVINENVLAADGTLNPGTYREWTPIGCYDLTYDYYSGVFEGNHKTISGLYSFGEAEAGLFGNVEDAVIQNLRLIDSYVAGSHWGAGIAANVGNTTISNCHNEATVTGWSGVGGIASIAYTSVIQNCSNNGYVIGSNEGIGGIAGLITDNTVLENCFNAGTINGDTYTGGLVGDNAGKVVSCYNIGAVKGTAYIGGLTGSTTAGGSIGLLTDSYNLGNVSGQEYIGGVTGSIWYYGSDKATVSNCYNIGKISAVDNMGGVAGVSEGIATNNYYMEGAAEGGINGEDVQGSAESRSAEAFKSGEVTWLLNEQTSTGKQIWGQKLTVDLYPVFSGDTVYRNQTGSCDAETYIYVYSNTEAAPVVTHNGNFVNGFCTACDGYEPAVLNGDVYEISNAGQLYWFAEKVNFGDTDINGKLMANIVINENVLAADGTLNLGTYREWTPIGDLYANETTTGCYSGVFDGNNKTISGLYYENEVFHVGLFGRVENGTIQNLGLIDSYISGEWFVGGIAGSTENTVIRNCFNESPIIGQCNVGGIVGVAYSGEVTNCHNTGNITGELEGIGGICGYGSATNCYNTGSVTGDTYVGGITGGNDGLVSNCYNSGDISGTAWIGGVSGSIYHSASDGKMSNCYNLGSVEGKACVGGVAGELNGAETSISDCYNVGNVTATEECGGGVIGTRNEGIATNNYYMEGAAEGGINGEDVIGSAEAKSAEQFKLGEVAYLLGAAYGQTIGTDPYPVFNDAKVYRNQIGGCTEDSFLHEYANAQADPVTSHSYGEPVIEGNKQYKICQLCGYTETHITTGDGNVEIESPEQPGLDFEVDPVPPSDERYVLVEESVKSDDETNREVLKTFDINLKNSQGVHVQPDGTVKVKLPVDWSKKGDYKVYRVNEDGTLTDMEAYRQGSHMVFVTDHFSIYVVVVETNDGFKTVDGVKYYYKDGRPFYAGLIEIGGSYYYVRSSGEVVVNREYWITKTNDLLPEKSYNFDEEGRIIDPVVPEESRDGITTVDGKLYYYKDGKPFYAGLIEIDGSYYYVRSSGELVVNREYWITKNNGLMTERSYVFDECGRMVLGSGFKTVDGVKYYYKDGRPFYAGLIEVDGSYYYVRSSGEVVVNREYWITKTNGLMTERSYVFDECGRMVLGSGFKTVDGVKYYYKDGRPFYAGLIEVDGSYYYVRSSGEVVVNRAYWITKTNDLLPEKSYNFDEEGRIIDPGVPEESGDGIKNVDGKLYYYKDGKPYYAGLIEIEGNYYYVRSSGKLAVGKYWVTKTNGLMKEASYQFDHNGVMLVPAVSK